MSLSWDFTNELQEIAIIEIIKPMNISLVLKLEFLV